MRKVIFIDFWLLLPPVILTIYSAILLATLSGEKYLAYYQVLFLLLGLLLFYLLSRVNYKTYFSIWPYLYGIGIFFLLLVLVLGVNKFGSARWINLGFFNFQPSEIFKFILVVSLVEYITSRVKVGWKEFITYLAILLPPVILVAVEPDLGTALLYLVTGLVIYFFAGKNRKFFYGILLSALVLMPLAYQFLLQPYQKERLTVFLNPKADVLGSGYNVWQSMIAIGSGGINGRGLGHGTQSQLQFLPVRYADFIYAVSSEAAGFIGSMMVLSLYFVFFSRIVIVANNSEDEKGYILGLGFLFIFFLQVVVNIGMNMGSMPITGLPLIFLSYGGSSLLTSFIILGVLNNLSRRGKKVSFGDV
ncbi:MAG: FtsW/RodA/SpoVE family cell cycle protein [Patescibacteria group bacterium]|nr:FtsW/RodA/SpoVE family cell cycle protein [Patescibacteria group bacterium]